VRTPRKWISRSLLAGAIVAAAGISLWHISAVQAEDAVVVDGQDAPDLDNNGPGMPGSNPRVKPFLDAHPDQLVVLCVAGCSGKPKIVQLLPRPVKGRAAEYRPSAASPDDASPDANSRVAGDESNDVVCMAGCSGKPGQVVQRILDLPPPVIANPPQEKTTEVAPAPKPEKRPEPLDVNP
jgi:hypothetical protein